MLARLAIAAATVLAYLAAAPRVVNGDGLGYLKAALAGTLYPGHLGYVPLLMALARLSGAASPLALLGPARLLSALAAATAQLALGATAARRGGEPAARAAMLGLGASWGMLAAGSDVESYAPALAALSVALWLADGQRPLAAGLATAAAALCHVENVLLAAPLVLVVARRRLRFATAAALPVAAAYAALVATHGAGALAGAGHGLRYPLHAWTPAIALYGACKTLVYAPYPYEASWPRVLGCFALGALAAMALATAMRRPRPVAAAAAAVAAPPLLPRRALAAWIAPYALVGVAFYASDAERWLFLLPLAWLAAASIRPRRALAVAALVAVAELVVWLPVARDSTLRDRARAAGQRLARGDLVVGPGHGWDEYLGFYDGAAVRPFPLVYWAGAVGPARLPATLAAAVAATRAAGGRVYLARLVDDGDANGWKELAQFGIAPANVRALLPPGHAVPLGDGLERWDP